MTESHGNASSRGAVRVEVPADWPLTQCASVAPAGACVNEPPARHSATQRILSPVPITMIRSNGRACGVGAGPKDNPRRHARANLTGRRGYSGSFPIPPADPDDSRCIMRYG